MTNERGRMYKKNMSAWSGGKAGYQPPIPYLIHHPLQVSYHQKETKYDQIDYKRRAVIHSTLKSGTRIK